MKINSLYHHLNKVNITIYLNILKIFSKFLMFFNYHFLLLHKFAFQLYLILNDNIF